VPGHAATPPSAGLFNTAAALDQSWELLNPEAAVSTPPSPRNGSVDSFKEQFAKAGVGRFGSGWGWLVADRSGGHVFSDPFRFSVRVCAGCLQSMFPDTPLCSAAPKPNPFPGNPCNIAQDGPEVLCCFDPNMTLICPAPNQ
jgi:hypothetical protein